MLDTTGLIQIRQVRRILTSREYDVLRNVRDGNNCSVTLAKALKMTSGAAGVMLRRLEGRWFLLSTLEDPPPKPKRGRRRRIYRLTVEGVDALTASREHWQMFAAGL